MTALWIGLYVAGALAAVPWIARWAYDPDDKVLGLSEPRTCVFAAFIICYAWPFFLVGWLLGRMSKRLAPLIFRTQGAEDGD